jgi:hypothetical protein
MGPRAGLDDMKEILDLTGTLNSGLSVTQPVPSLYTDCDVESLTSLEYIYSTNIFST